jgi:putative oxidoreductase
MINIPNRNDWGLLLLRLMVGGMMLPHGISKLMKGVDGIAGLFASKGIPGFFAYGAYIGEIIAPILVLLGFFARISALVITGTILVAVAVAHPDEIFTLTRTGAWGIELQAFYIFGGVAIALLGAGSYSLDAKKGRA